LDALALIGDTLYGDYGETFWSRGYVDIRRITDSYNPFLAFWRSRQSGSGAVQNNDLLGRISALGHDGTDWSSGSRIRINLRAAQNWSSTAHGTKLDVEVTPTGSTTPVTAVTIDENGLKNERTNTVRTKDYTLTVPGTGTAVLGSGTTNTIPKFTGTNAVGDSIISEISDGVQIQIGKTLVLNGFGLDTDGYLAKYPQSTIRDHFTTSNMSSYWTGWTYTPGAVAYNSRNHFLIAFSNVANSTFFLYKTQTVPTNESQMEAWIGTDVQQTSAGIRMDNGYVDNANEYSIELYLKSGVGSYPTGVALFLRKNAYGTITEIQLCDQFPPSKAYRVILLRDNTYIYVYAGDEVLIAWVGLSGTTISPGITFTRHGLFVRATVSDPRMGQFHYYATNF
jgi:Tfp pilus assembly major pilin PilA